MKQARSIPRLFPFAPAVISIIENELPRVEGLSLIFPFSDADEFMMPPATRMNGHGQVSLRHHRAKPDPASLDPLQKILRCDHHAKLRFEWDPLL